MWNLHSTAKCTSKQMDRVAMRSPLGPVLANIFKGYCEDRISKEQALLDINISRMGQHLLRSIYRKKTFTSDRRRRTFTGLYIRYDSFCPRHHKLATIKSLASRAKRICTPSLLQDELDNLRSIFIDNGFPIIISKCIEQAMDVKSVATEKDKTRIVFR